MAGVFLLMSAAAGKGALWAQTVAPDAVIRSWDARDGVPPGLINDIQRTANGYLWVATRVGVARFDGARFKLFDARNTTGLRTNWVSCLLAEPDGGLWLGTPDGLFRLLDGEHGATTVVEVGSHLGIGAIAPGTTGVVWILSLSNDLVRVRGGRVDRRFKGPGGLPVRAVAADASGRVVAACGDTLYTVDSTDSLVRASKAGWRSGIDAICPSRRGGFWIASGKLVSLLRETGETFVPGAEATSRGFPPARIIALLEDREGRLWAGTRNGGIYCSEGGAAWRQFTARRPRSFGGISCLYEDAEGLIWAGTSAGILRQITPRLVTAWSLPTTMQEHIPQTICVAHDGAVWVGTDGAGAYRCQNGAFTRFGAEQGLTSATVMAILEDRQTNLWFGTYSGLFRLDNAKLRPALVSVLSGQAVASLFQDQAGDLWFGLVGKVIRKHGEELTTYELGESFQDFEVRAFAEGPQGVIWMGTYGGGLFRLAEGRVDKDESFPRPALTALHHDHDGALWVGTLNNGLFRLQNGNLGHWRAREGLPGNTLYAILEDKAGMLWLSSNEGVFGLSKLALQAYQKESDAPVPVIHLATSDLENWSAGSGQPAACYGPDGRLWFPVGHGVVSFDPSAVTRSRPAFPVLIEEVLVDGVERPHGGVDSLRVLSGVRRLEFHYTVADLGAQGRLKFRYRLEGVDDQWINAGPERVASYGYLPSGKYRFQVIASGSQSGWSEMAPLAVEVVPRLWERHWFQVLSAVAILCAVAGTARGLERAKVRRKMERLELQQTMEKERRRIARDLHDDLGAGLTEIMLLGEVARRDGASASEAQGQLSTITDKARRLAAAVDEVVWTVNPKNDLLPNLASYMCDYAREFFRHATAHCRIDVAEPLSPVLLGAQTRHDVFLAVKEALNNAAKHSGATEVWLRVHCAGDELAIAVEDNGCGFDPAVAQSGDGLANLTARMQGAGGRAEIVSQPGRGTKVRLCLPLPRHSVER